MKKVYILVGTYKTQNENNGWYIHKRYSILWDKMGEKFNGSYSHTDCVVSKIQGRIAGKIKGVNNFYFYDIKPHDLSLNGKTKDKEVFKLKRNDFKTGLSILFKEITSNPNTEYHIGLQGNNVVGLFLTHLYEPERIDKVLLGSIAKKYATQFFGYIDNEKLPDNVKLFKIYNLTQPKRNNELFHQTWNEFLEI